MNGWLGIVRKVGENFGHWTDIEQTLSKTDTTYTYCPGPTLGLRA